MNRIITIVKHISLDLVFILFIMSHLLVCHNVNITLTFFVYSLLTLLLIVSIIDIYLKIYIKYMYGGNN